MNKWKKKKKLWERLIKKSADGRISEINTRLISGEKNHCIFEMNTNSIIKSKSVNTDFRILKILNEKLTN